MKTLFAFMFLFSFINKDDLADLRKQFILASESKSSATNFYNKMKMATKESNAVVLAYKGASSALMGKYCAKIAEKKTYLLEGGKLIELAIKTEPQNIEIRIIRLSIQEHTPKIAKYKGNINEDKEFIIRNYTYQNVSLKEFIKNYVAVSKVFSETEKTKLFND